MKKKKKKKKKQRIEENGEKDKGLVLLPMKSPSPTVLCAGICVVEETAKE
ncbi:hypothetical protein Csa_013902 [Cucumis sativus]|uniref:Uncharacterized protein n=1 Tax=Cucumis sativus TaxID=3659 RepID=A0A0A0LUA2_CUCSA|nr:hypothetical protein Csa_013902 [Cucumis sativus]